MEWNGSWVERAEAGLEGETEREGLGVNERGERMMKVGVFC